MVGAPKRGPLLHGKRLLSQLRKVVLLVACGEASADEIRVEGIVDAIHGPNFVDLRTDHGIVTVDFAALGGVTVAVTPGQMVAVLGTMDPTSHVVHVIRLVSPQSP